MDSDIRTQYEALKKMREFMFEDLDRAIHVKTNFLVAMALAAYTEIIGEYYIGRTEKKGTVRGAFEAFFRQLGKEYGDLIDKRNSHKEIEDLDIYTRVRCGLVHEYTVKKSAIINMGTGPCGIEFKEFGTIQLNVETYYHDFRQAVDKYIEEMPYDPVLTKKFKDAMDERPLIT